MAEWMEFVKNVGVPVAILAVVLFEARVLGKWIAGTVVKPIVRSHQRLLLELTEGQRRISRRISALCKRIDRVLEETDWGHHKGEQPPGQNEGGS